MNMATSEQKLQLEQIVTDAKRLAIEYRRLTSRPLGITGEIGEIEAARLLSLQLAEVRQAGYDAFDPLTGIKYQIKTRCLSEGASASQRVGGIKLENEWDEVLLVILDQVFEPMTIHQATRTAVTEALLAPGSRARNERGALSVSKFKSIGTMVWKRT